MEGGDLAAAARGFGCTCCDNHVFLAADACCCAAAATAGGEDSGKPHSSQQQQEGQQQQEDAEWLSVCQKAYADHMELLSSELAAFGTEAAVALQQLVARTVAESSSGALAWQQQLMLQDALYVLSVFAAYSDTIAAELLRQQKQTANFQEAIAKLVSLQPYAITAPRFLSAIK